MEETPTKELMVFRRRRETDDVADDESRDDLDELAEDSADDLDEPDDAETDVDDRSSRYDEPYAVAVPPRPTGPWDLHDVPKTDETPRIDLGGLHVPVPEGLEVRVEVQDDIPVAATLVDGQTQLQVHAFAAPKSSGLWADVRAEIADSLNGSGGSAAEADGPFGAELRARILVEDGTQQSARFIGVDGPRWFLRGLLTGPGSTDPTQAKRLEDAFRAVVVNRGSDAMAPRDMLPLHLPREAFDGLPHDHDHDDHDHSHDHHDHSHDQSFELPERGPEITETR